MNSPNKRKEQDMKFIRRCEGNYITEDRAYTITKDGWWNCWNLYHNGKYLTSFRTLREAKAEAEERSRI